MRVRVTSIAIVAALAATTFLLGALRPGSAVDRRLEDRPPAVSDVGSGFAPAPSVGSLDATIASLEERLDRVPGDWRAAAALGIAHVQRARITSDPYAYPAAEASLVRSLDLRPEGNVEALVGLGTLAAARHDFAAALSWGRRAVRTAPFDADAYGMLGDAQLELGRYAAAFRSFQRMVDTRPDLASYARVSYAMELQGRTDAAIEAMRAAHDVAAGPADAAWAAAHVGKLHFERGRLRESAVWFRRARAADPGSIDAEAGLALVAWATGDLGKAIAGYERVVTRVPSPEHVGVLGDLYAAAGDRGAAAECYALVRAEARLFRANGVDVDLELALFEADHPAGGSARAALRAARAEWHRRTSVHVADAYAWALYANGRYRAAAEIAARALRLGTRNAAFLFHAGMIELRLGHEPAARGLLRDAFDTNPFFSVRWSPMLRSTLASLGSP
ncbi:MAG TPA: tetratricopeptide repeat protein [Actinomycetota bacterium]|nr:tetratricopeptide repeat protein [Actinomycetota bacterium]